MRESRAKKSEAAPKSAQKPRWIAWVIKLSFAGLFLLMLMILAAVLLVQTGPVRSFLKNMLVAQLESRLSATVAIGNIKGSFISNFAIEDVQVTKDGNMVLSLERLSAEYALPLLIKHMVFINAVTLDGLEVNLCQRADGSWNVMDLAKQGDSDPASEAPKAPGFKVVVQNLLVQNSRVTLEDKTGEPENRQLDVIRCGIHISVGQKIAFGIMDSKFSISRPKFSHVAITGSAVFDPVASLLKIESLDVRSEASYLTLAGHLSFEKEPSYDVTLGCSPLSLQELDQALGLSQGLRENMTGTLCFKGDTSRLACRADMEYQEALFSAKGDIALASLPNLNMHMEGALRRLNPARLPFDALKSYDGSINTDFKASLVVPEVWTAGQGRLSLEVLPSPIAGTKINAGGLSLELLNGNLLLKDTFFSSPLGNCRAEGRVSNFADNRREKKAEVSVFLTNLNPQQIPQLKPSGLSGTLDLDIKAMASLPAGGAFSEGVFTLYAMPHDATITAFDKKLPADVLHAARLEGAWHDPHLIVKSFQLDTNLGAVTAKGRMNTKDLTARVTAGADLADLGRLSEALFPFISGLPQDLDLSGAAQIDATIDGALASPKISCRMSGTNIGAMTFSAKDLKAQAQWDMANWGGDATASLKLVGFEAKGNRFDTIEAQADLKNAGGTFALGVRHEKGHQLDMAGKFDLAKNSWAGMTIDHLSLQTKGPASFGTLKNHGPIQLKRRQGGIEVVSFRVASGEAQIDLAGVITDQGDQNLNISIQKLKLSELPLPASKEIAVDGSLNLDLRVTGSLAAPMISGSLLLSKGTANLLKKGLTYEQLEANIFFNNDGIDIQRAVIKGDKEGYLQATGHFGLKDGMPSKFDITLSGDDFLVPYQKSIYAKIAPQLTLSGEMDAPVLKGEVQVLEGRINLDRMAPETPPEIEIITATSGKGAEQHIADGVPPSELLQKLAAHITVKAPGNVWLKGQDINTEVAGDVLLKKEAQKPFTLLGELQTLRGVYYFRGKQFKVEKGTVTFIGLEEPNPNIDIMAAAKIQQTRIIILISGTARNLVLKLDSDPKMDPSDIISYLVFGKSTDALKGGQAFNAEKAALGLSGGLLASELRSILGDVFFIDSFALDAGDNGAGGAVAVGKYVRPNIFILYRRGLAEEKQNQIEVSYEYSPNIRIETQLGDDKNNGVDLFWEFDF